MDHLGYLFAAYMAIWTLVFLYIRMVARRNQRLEREIDELKAHLEK